MFKNQVVAVKARSYEKMLSANLKRRIMSRKDSLNQML